MAVQFPQGLDIRSKTPVDIRIVLTKAQMATTGLTPKSDLEKVMPPQYFALCSDDKKLYIYDVNNEFDEETGRYRVYPDNSESNNTIYRIIADTEVENKWQLQHSVDQGITWLDAEGTVDLSLVISEINARIDAIETHEYTITKEDGTSDTTYHLTKDDVAQGEAILVPKSSHAEPDEESIVYNVDDKLEIKGYSDALQGYMLVKDETEGLSWIKPLDDTQLNKAVADATAKAQEAGNHATAAGSSAITANNAAQQAEAVGQYVLRALSDKFWWGTIDEYNALETIDEGTFYFIYDR